MVSLRKCSGLQSDQPYAPAPACDMGTSAEIKAGREEFLVRGSCREDGGVLAQVSSQELAKGPTPDRMAALAGHVIGQSRCFSPSLLINPLLHPLAVPELPTHPSTVPVPYILQVFLSFQLTESLHLIIRQNARATLPQPLDYCSLSKPAS